MRAVHRALLTCVLLLLAAPAVARAEGEPIMPLEQVQKGMRCQAASVFQGTAISSFDIEILDVIQGDSAAEAPRILFRASGAAVDATGVGPGFSGSPIRCPDGAGVMRNIGAISEGIGEYGGKVALATPIQLILGEPVEPPASARRSSATLRSARPLATPLTLAGASGPMAGALQRAAKRAGRVLLLSPGTAPRSSFAFPVAPLVPGSAVAVGYTSGAVSIGAVGTVAYVDGSTVWAFGHPLDGAGRRSLLLQDAYVYTVVNNPVQSSELSTYKLAAPGHDIGTLSNDANSAVVGVTGAAPPTYPLQVVAHDLDTGRVRSQVTKVTDESDLGLPAGGSALSLAATTAVGNAAAVTLSGASTRQSGSMCMRVTVRELKKPMRFCNTYVGGGPGPNSAVVGDVGTAVSLLDTFEFANFHISKVDVNLKLRRSYPQAFIRKATVARRAVRRGSRLKVRLSLRRSRGGIFSRTISVRVPRGMPVGDRKLLLEGTGPDTGGSVEDSLTSVLDLGSLAPDSDGDEPRTLGQLRTAFGDIHRYDGITTSFQPEDDDSSVEDELAELLGDSSSLPDGAEGIAQRPRETYRDPALRIGGSARIRVTVRP